MYHYTFIQNSECTTLRVTPNIHWELWVIMICQGILQMEMNVPLVGTVDSEQECALVGTGGVFEVSTLSTQCCCEPKALGKWSFFFFNLNQKITWIQLLPVFICYPGFTYNLTILCGLTLMAFGKEAWVFSCLVNMGLEARYALFLLLELYCLLPYQTPSLLTSTLPDVPPYSLNFCHYWNSTCWISVF